MHVIVLYLYSIAHFLFASARICLPYGHSDGGSRTAPKVGSRVITHVSQTNNHNHVDSVQLLRRVDTRIPSPLLSAFVASTAPSLGKLADLRSSNTPWRRDPLLSAPVPSKPGSTQRGWTSVATRSATATPAPPKIPSPALSHGIRGGQSTGSTPRPPASSTVMTSREPEGIVAEHDVPDNWEDDI